MPSFNEVQKTQWNSNSLKITLPGFNLSLQEDITRLNSLLNNTLPDDIQEIKTVFFTSLQPDNLQGIELLFKKIDERWEPCVYPADDLMRTIYHKIMRPFYNSLHESGECLLFQRMLEQIVTREISRELKIELLANVWSTIIMPAIAKSEGQVVDMAEVFLLYLTRVTKKPSVYPKGSSFFNDAYIAIGEDDLYHRTYERPTYLRNPNFIVGIATAEPSFREFLLIERDLLLTRLDSIVLPFLQYELTKIHSYQQNALLFAFSHEELKKIIIKSSGDLSFDGFFFRNTNSDANTDTISLMGFNYIWEQIIEIDSPIKNQKVQSFINCLEKILGFSREIAQTLSHIAKNFPNSRAELLNSLPLRYLYNLIEPTNEERITCLKRRWREKVELRLSTHPEVALEFIRDMFCGGIFDTDDRLVNDCVSLLAMFPNFRMPLLTYWSKEHEKYPHITLDNPKKNLLRLIFEMLKWIPENGANVFALKKPFIDMMLAYDLPQKMSILNENNLNFTVDNFLNDLLVLDQQLTTYPEGKETLLRTVNQCLQKQQEITPQTWSITALRQPLQNNQLVENLRREWVLNKFAHSRQIAWIFLTYAYEVPLENVHSIRDEFEFLVKFRSLNNTPFRHDSEHIALYPKASSSLINKLNRTAVCKTNYLSIERIEIPITEKIGISSFFGYQLTGAQLRVTQTLKHLPPEQRKQLENNSPDACYMPDSVQSTSSSSQYHLPSAPPAVIDTNYIDLEVANAFVNNILDTHSHIIQQNNNQNNVISAPNSSTIILTASVIDSTSIDGVEFPNVPNTPINITRAVPISNISNNNIPIAQLITNSRGYGNVVSDEDTQQSTSNNSLRVANMV